MKLDECEDGEVPERFNGHAWKACVGANSPQVRILSSPPYTLAVLKDILWLFRLTNR